MGRWSTVADWLGSHAPQEEEAATRAIADLPEAANIAENTAAKGRISDVADENQKLYPFPERTDALKQAARQDQQLSGSVEKFGKKLQDAQPLSDFAQMAKKPVNSLLNSATNNSQFNPSALLSAPVNNVVQGARGVLDATEAPRQAFIDATAKQLDLGRNSVGENPEFQQAAKTAMNYTLPTALDAVTAGAGRFAKLGMAAQKAPSELNMVSHIAPIEQKVSQKALAAEATGVPSLQDQLANRAKSTADLYSKEIPGGVIVQPTAEELNLSRLQEINSKLPKASSSKQDLMQQYLTDPENKDFLNYLNKTYSGKYADPNYVKKLVNNHFGDWAKAQVNE